MKNCILLRKSWNVIVIWSKTWPLATPYTNARVLLKTHNLNIWCHSSCRAIVYCGIFWAHFCPHDKIFRSLSGIIFLPLWNSVSAQAQKTNSIRKTMRSVSENIESPLALSKLPYMLCALTSLSHIFLHLNPLQKNTYSTFVRLPLVRLCTLQ